MKPITIIIVDDHKLVREAWMELLNNEQHFSVLGTCGSAGSAIESVKQLAPDIVLLDINLPDISGIEAIPDIQQASPYSKIIGISLHALPHYARKMMKEGASGYVTKNSSNAEMIQAIFTVYAGKKFICHKIKEIIAEQLGTEENGDNKLNTLSARQLEIIEFLKKGLSSKEIAATLYISVKTVEVHRYNILKKLGFKNTASVIDFYNKN
jgi:DNA-binding NarL/FixJ family response regulator